MRSGRGIDAAGVPEAGFPAPAGGGRRALDRSLGWTPRAVLSALSLLALLGLLPLSALPAGAQTPQVLLVQNSGWMEPFLTAPDSQFRPLVKALAAATRAVPGPVTVAAFNQDGQVAGRSSPQTLYAGPYEAGAVAAAIDRIDLPTKTGSRAYADADFNGALLGTLRTLLRGQEGVVWMITNNKNAPGNSAEVQANTAAFYASLRGAEAITRIVAYPVRMPLQGRNFREGGFVIYGIGYGAGGGRALDAILADAPIRALFSHPPVSLKPVLDGGVGLVLDGVEAGPLSASLENGVLVVRGARAEQGAALTLRARLRNGYYPQRIASASVALSWRELGAGEAALARAAIAPARVEALPAGGESGPYTVTLTIPPIPRKPGLAGLLADDRTVDGTLAITLRDLVLDLDPAFLERVRPIFGGGLFAQGQARSIESQMPDIFLDFRATPQATQAPQAIQAPQATQPAGRDFVIPPPSAAPRTEAPPRGETVPHGEASPFTGLRRGATTTETVLGLGVLLVLAVVFLFVRASVRAHLIGRRAALDAANGAAWALFAALMLTATVLVTAAVGDLWQYGLGLAAALALCAALFLIFAVLFVRAPQRRR